MSSCSPSTSGRPTSSSATWTRFGDVARDAQASTHPLSLHARAARRDAGRADHGQMAALESASGSPASSPTATSSARATSRAPGASPTRGGPGPRRAVAGLRPSGRPARRPPVATCASSTTRRWPRSAACEGQGVELVITLGTGLGLALVRRRQPGERARRGRRAVRRRAHLRPVARRACARRGRGALVRASLVRAVADFAKEFGADDGAPRGWQRAKRVARRCSPTCRVR